MSQEITSLGSKISSYIGNVDAWLCTVLLALAWFQNIAVFSYNKEFFTGAYQ
jgi:hypothetical protein